ncbi:MAG: ABC transporter ATP-binding protein [Candidatus Nanopelagicales bacterium]
MTSVDVRSLTAGYGALTVLEDLDLHVPSGAVAAVLGPSGSGKTTLLRVLAGFLKPTSGTVTFGDRLVAGAGQGFPHAFVPPEKRRIGIVPQEGALFPHLDVSANVGFGLPTSPAQRAESAARVREVLEMVGMLDYAHTRPHELSGGQQQRVALARALAPKPDVILLDEPFTALDAALRVRLRAEVRELLLGLGTTAILITHDQEEALSTADLVAVMRDGRIVQVGSPLDVYDVPADLGVARFVGDAVELPAVVSTGQAQCALGEISTHPSTTAPDGHAVVVLRPEQLVLSCPVEPSGVPGQGIVRETSYHGHDSLLRVELADGTLIPVRVPGGTPPPRPGDDVVVSVTGPGRVYPA